MHSEPHWLLLLVIVAQPTSR